MSDDKGNMKELLNAVLERIKSKVFENLEAAKKNEENIRELLLNPETYERAYNLQLKFDFNHKILHENQDFLELQLKIVNFINKYRHTDLMQMPLVENAKIDQSNIDYFAETIAGRITFNEYHPYYLDEAFINMLLEHYQQEEKYEECQRLSEIKRKITS
jgi:hypothetical protein